ncbi:MAG: hypothetical protein JJ902_23275 [Roseibium sp.]|nr:hypothetical protein [Roseibium sp.]
MTAYYDAVDAVLNSKGADRQVATADCLYFDFLGAPIRIWSGEGEMVTPDGETWTGFMTTDTNGEAVSLFHMQPMGDVRDGNAPLYELSLHYLDETTYRACRDDRDQVAGRNVLISSVLLPDNGSTRSLTPPGDTRRLRMLDTKFNERRTRGDGGAVIVHRSIVVTAKNLNEGRSLTFFGTLADTVQRARSKQLFGIEDDHYCQFVGKYANGYTVKVF